MEALTCLPPLELIVQGEARMAAHGLWSLDAGCTCIQTKDTSILKQLQQSDPILNMEVDVMRPAFNLEPKYGVIMLTREDWTSASLWVNTQRFSRLRNMLSWPVLMIYNL